MGKGKSWNVDETRLLITSWLNVSQNALTGTDQTSDGFWKSITTLYNDTAKKEPNKYQEERNEKSCKNRWCNVNKDVCKFYGHYMMIRRNIHSGWDDKMYLEQAIESWKSLPGSKGKPFKLFFAWEMLKDSPKWTSTMQLNKQDEAKDSEAPADQQADHSQRPIGNRAAKENSATEKKRNRKKIDPDDLTVKQVRLAEEFVQTSQKKLKAFQEDMAMSFFDATECSRVTAIL